MENNKYKWSSQEPTRSTRTPLHNLVSHLSELRATAIIDEHQNTEKVWNLLFDDTMCSITVQWTNAKLHTICQKYRRADKPELKPVDDIEMSVNGALCIHSHFQV